MFKKLLASAGIGSAEVDTQLINETLSSGDMLRGKVVIKGGRTEQQVDRINLFVMTEALRERDDKKYYEKVVLHRFALNESFTIGAGERKEIDFEFELPIHTPPTINRTRVWVQTGLDIPQAIDPNDRDYLQVTPHIYMDTVLRAITHELGFELRKVDMEHSRRHGYIQEFEFRPSPEFRSDLDELEAVFFVKEDRIELVLQVDRRVKGLGSLFAEALDMDESNVRLSFTKSEIEQGALFVADKLRDVIKQYS
ncbi:sporulation-control protein [Gracilibacillus ureilyticus]|uniref:Sporulation-control protein n=1 Tax=Gracilibacillus ureilyticus TaxID=531814 RepID=A0A1H9NF55_9BACI|nr:sporulation protein [Gracilibacillus ureilyticus]SER34528.1 sporulation-control protein [Gracilibacillus ureilyticus]